MRTHTKTFHIRFTEKEYDRLCKYADKAGLPKTTYIRHMINGCCPREAAPEFWTLIKEIHALGNNLNQLTNLAHKFGSIHAAKLDEMMEQYKRLVPRIYDGFYLPENVNISATLERGKQVTEAEDSIKNY